MGFGAGLRSRSASWGNVSIGKQFIELGADLLHAEIAPATYRAFRPLVPNFIGIIVVHFKADMAASADALSDDGGGVPGNAGVRGVERAHLQIVDPHGEDRIDGDTTDAKAIPVV